MWLLVEWSEDTDMYPSYRIILKKNVLNKKGEDAKIGKYVRFRDKRTKKKRRAKVVMLSESKRTLKEHKHRLIKRGRKVKEIMTECMRTCHREMKRKLAPEPEHSDCLPGPSKICMLRTPRIPNMPTSPSSSGSSSSTSPRSPRLCIPSPIIIHNSSSSTTSPSDDKSRARSKRRMPAPLEDRTRSRSPHASRNHSKSRHDRYLSRHRKPMLRSRSMVCSTSNPPVLKPRKIVFDNFTQTDSTQLHKPTVELFMLFIRQLHSHFLKLLEKIEELRVSRNQNETTRPNESESSDNSKESEDLSHQHLIEILKGLNVNVQLVGVNTKHANENARDSNETAPESDENVQSSDSNTQRPDENSEDLEKNSSQIDTNDRDSDESDNIVDDNYHVNDENDRVADQNYYVDGGNDHVADKNCHVDDEYDHHVADKIYQVDNENDHVVDENDHVADSITDYVVLNHEDIMIDDKLFADADMQELEEINLDRDDDMQVLNEDVPSVAENAKNEKVDAQILHENVPVQSVVVEPRQLPGYPEPSEVPVFAEPKQLPGYAEPRLLTIFEEPRQLPGYSEPRVAPVFEKTEQQPGYPEPTGVPVSEDPEQLPGCPESSEVPVMTEPSQLPGYPEPKVLPIFEEPRKPPAFFAGSSRQPAIPGPSRPIAAVEPRRSEVCRVYARSQRCIYGDEEMVPIGFNRTLIPRRLLNEINWITYTTATRQLLQAVFPRRILATHSLSGRPSPAFTRHPAKERLDPRLVDDIVETVRAKCGAQKQWIRSVISSKCTEEARMYRNLQNQLTNPNNENQEIQYPEAGPSSSQRRQQDESSSSSD